MEIQGYCDERFGKVRDAFAENFSERADIGACFAATLEGEFVVDLWGGHQDAERQRPWQEDTIINVYSSTKTMTFICALMLADRGQLDLDAPVANYWPEFSANGKENVLVKHILSHSAGLPGFSRVLTADELYDWDLCCADLAAQASWWEAGTQSGYHAITQGYLVGEVVRRVTGQTIGQYFKAEVADKVSADFHIGVDPKDFGRVADLVPAAETAPILEMDPESIPGRVFAGLDISPGTTGSAGWRQAEIPAANGHGNARSIVRAQTAMANGGSAFGIKLLSGVGCAKALELQTEGPDLVLGLVVKYALGYGLPTADIPISPNANTLFWGGAGGSTVVVDTEARACFSYVMNQMDNFIIGGPRGQALASAMYDSLAELS
ncbi:MAG: CubicO group peptidase (beta-lactamase class C family) [Limisphaerales bacterium]|jgi:CubicO group peptidase (beta-lactamase class C family)